MYSFLSEAVPDPLLKTILDDATHVPSAGFTQDFDFIVVKETTAKKHLADAAHQEEYVKKGLAPPDFISRAPVLIVPCGNKSRFESKYGLPAEKNSRLPWWLIDAGFASLVLILSAFEKGLAASFLGAIDDAKIAEALGLPTDNSIVPLAVIPIGYPTGDNAAKRRSSREEVRRRRRKLDEAVHWNRW